MEKRQCKKCKEIKIKESDFYFAHSNHDGYNMVCKQCCGIYKQKRYYKKRKEILAYQKAYLKKRRKIPEIQIKIKAYEKKYYKENKIKCLARAKLRKCVKNGKIKKMACEICNYSLSEGHHFDYSRPLDVVWLCKKHHDLFHYEKTELLSQDDIKIIKKIDEIIRAIC
ncbi:MAG: hypothetical protein ABII94_00855 [Patescibacteria group bacterium]